jgi:hypothetical protein
MSKIIGNKECEDSLRTILDKEGYELTDSHGDVNSGETGVDLIAKKGEQVHYIEVIGYSSSGPKRTKDFNTALIQALSRLDDGAKSCVIAIPIEYEQGINSRYNQKKTFWHRIGNAFPELSIWYVDTHHDTLKKYKWSYIIENDS